MIRERLESPSDELTFSVLPSAFVDNVFDSGFVIFVGDVVVLATFPEDFTAVVIVVVVVVAASSNSIVEVISVVVGVVVGCISCKKVIIVSLSLDWLIFAESTVFGVC